MRSYRGLPRRRQKTDRAPLEQIARHGVGAIRAMILEDDDGFIVEQALAAFGRVDLHAFDIELDDMALLRRHQSLFEKAIQSHCLNALAQISAVRITNAERLVFRSAEPNLVAGARSDSAVQHLEAPTVELGVAGKLCRVVRGRFDRDDRAAAERAARNQDRPESKFAPPSMKP